MAYLSKEERRQRIIALVKEKTGVDCPELEVQDIWNAFDSVRVFYWCEAQDVENNKLLKHIRLDDKEAESIGVNRIPRDYPETGGA